MANKQFQEHVQDPVTKKLVPTSVAGRDVGTTITIGVGIFNTDEEAILASESTDNFLALVRTTPLVPQPTEFIWSLQGQQSATAYQITPPSNFNEFDWQHVRDNANLCAWELDFDNATFGHIESGVKTGVTFITSGGIDGGVMNAGYSPNVQGVIRYLQFGVRSELFSTNIGGANLSGHSDYGGATSFSNITFKLVVPPKP